MQRTAAAGGGLLLLGTGTTFAQQDDEQAEEPMFDDQPNTDVDVLNYLLPAKRLQRDLYAQAVEEFSEGDFGDDQESEDTTTPGEDEETTDEEDDGATAPEDEEDGNETTAPDDEEDENATDAGGNETSALQQTQQASGSLYATLEEISSQKEQHVTVLEQTVELLGGGVTPQPGGDMTRPEQDDNTTEEEDSEDTAEQPDEDDNTTQQDDETGGTEGTTQPEQEQSFEFEFEDADGFLQTAAEVENTIAGAHLGAAGYIESPDLLNAVLSIYAVDARHAGVVNRAAGQPAAPEAFEQALSQSEVQDTVSQFAGGGGADTGVGGDEEDDTGVGEDDGTDGNETENET
ncbi:ferritin-like domain-containing protein [Halovenus sp. HT40]|uniref:ferritin-like domain-containing protein n=1 Tax=Halovenus sp. HT40 TaxID=3126691 RepID=UPI00300E7D8F